jgi:putative membrane protein
MATSLERSAPRRLFLPLTACILTLCAVALADSLNSSDSDFLKKAAKGNLAEVDLGRLAARKAVNPEVKQFANRMIRDHSKAYGELKTLAASKGVDVAKSASLSEDASAVHLKMLSGKSFDEAYVKMMVEDHKEDVADFQQESQSATDSDVKNFASKTLPILQSHLDKITQIQADFNSGGSK